MTPDPSWERYMKGLQWGDFLAVLAVIFYPLVFWYGALAIEAWWHWVTDFVPAWLDSLNL